MPASISNCEIPLIDYSRRFAPVGEFLKRLPSEADVDVISLSDVLCSQKSCVTEIDSTFLYRDPGHLSYDGSLLLARRLDLAKLIVSRAR